MKMTRFEKLIVNREKKGRQNAERVRRCLEQLDTRAIHDVLELGCGIGVVSALLAQALKFNVCGTDFDPEQIELARRAYPENDRLRFKVEDATHLNLPAESFDLVVAQNVFHHVPNWEAAVHEVSRVLRPEGHFIWFDFAAPNPLRKVLQSLLRSAGVYTIDDITSAFKGNGLESRAYEKVSHGLFAHHNFVLQKVPLKAAQSWLGIQRQVPAHPVAHHRNQIQ